MRPRPLRLITLAALWAFTARGAVVEVTGLGGTLNMAAGIPAFQAELSDQVRLVNALSVLPSPSLASFLPGAPVPTTQTGVSPWRPEAVRLVGALVSQPELLAKHAPALETALGRDGARDFVRAAGVLREKGASDPVLGSQLKGLREGLDLDDPAAVEELHARLQRIFEGSRSGSGAGTGATTVGAGDGPMRRPLVTLQKPDRLRHAVSVNPVPLVAVNASPVGVGLGPMSAEPNLGGPAAPPSSGIEREDRLIVEPRVPSAAKTGFVASARRRLEEFLRKTGLDRVLGLEKKDFVRKESGRLWGVVEEFWSGVYPELRSRKKGSTLVLFDGRGRKESYYDTWSRETHLDGGELDGLDLKTPEAVNRARLYLLRLLAHEYGHHIQNHLGMLDAIKGHPSAGDTNRLRKMFELHADGLAGQVMAYSRVLGMEEPGDALTMEQVSAEVGTDHLDPDRPAELDTHGTSAQRTAWLKRGYAARSLREIDPFADPDLRAGLSAGALAFADQMSALIARMPERRSRWKLSFTKPDLLRHAISPAVSGPGSGLAPGPSLGSLGGSSLTPLPSPTPNVDPSLGPLNGSGAVEDERPKTDAVTDKGPKWSRVVDGLFKRLTLFRWPRAARLERERPKDVFKVEAGRLWGVVEEFWEKVYPDLMKKKNRSVLVLFDEKTTFPPDLKIEGSSYDIVTKKTYLKRDELNDPETDDPRLINAARLSILRTLAHEYGHHVQNHLGLFRLVYAVSVPKPQRNRLSVMLELHADALAGFMARYTYDLGMEQLNDAAVMDLLSHHLGSDVRAPGITADEDTHGSGAQRLAWFRRGYAAKSLRDIDPFASPELRRGLDDISLVLADAASALVAEIPERRPAKR